MRLRRKSSSDSRGFRKETLSSNRAIATPTTFNSPSNKVSPTNQAHSNKSISTISGGNKSSNKSGNNQSPTKNGSNKSGNPKLREKLSLNIGSNHNYRLPALPISEPSAKPTGGLTINSLAQSKLGSGQNVQNMMATSTAVDSEHKNKSVTITIPKYLFCLL